MQLLLCKVHTYGPAPYIYGFYLKNALIFSVFDFPRDAMLNVSGLQTFRTKILYLIVNNKLYIVLHCKTQIYNIS